MRPIFQLPGLFFYALVLALGGTTLFLIFAIRQGEEQWKELYGEGQGLKITYRGASGKITVIATRKQNPNVSLVTKTEKATLKTLDNLAGYLAQLQMSEGAKEEDQERFAAALEEVRSIKTSLVRVEIDNELFFIPPMPNCGEKKAR